MQENDVTADREGESSQAPAFDAPHSSDERTWAALAHASTLLNAATGMGGLIAAAAIWLTQKEKSAWVAFHGLQSLIFQAVQYLIVSLVVGTVWVEVDPILWTTKRSKEMKLLLARISVG
jgi:uncharacterized Tic20 family protein